MNKESKNWYQVEGTKQTLATVAFVYGGVLKTSEPLRRSCFELIENLVVYSISI